MFALEEVNLLIGKIQCRFDQHAQRHQLVAQGMHLARERAIERAHRSTRRLCGSGFNQIGDALGLRKIELAIEIGAARELARLGQAATKFKAARKQQVQHHRPTVALQFEHVFASVGVRSFEVERQPRVNRHALRVPKHRQRRHPRR